MSTITINGATFYGNNVTVKNNRVFIDGADITPNSRQININVTGNVESLDVDACDRIEIAGNVGKLISGSGNISCSDVSNGITVGSGDVTCNTITGDVRTGSGDIDCQTITGSVKTGSGDIKFKK